MAFKSLVQHNIGSTPVVLYTVPASNTSIVIGLDVANIVDSTISVSVTVEKSGGSTINYVKNAPIPPGSTLQIVAGQKVVIEQNDIVKISSNTVNGADAIISILEGA